MTQILDDGGPALAYRLLYDNAKLTNRLFAKSGDEKKPKEGDPASSSSGDSGNNNNKNEDDNNDDNDKISSLLLKAFLWMLTAYMFIAIVSLLFPGSNQPEVSHEDEVIVDLYANLISYT